MLKNTRLKEFRFKMFARILACLLVLNCNPVASQEFRVVMEPSPPLQYLSDGQQQSQGKIAGLVAERVSNLFQEVGIDARFEVFPWTRALSLAQAEDNVFISNIARTPKREKLFKWIGVVYSYNFALVSPSKSNLVLDLESAKNFTIAVQRNDIAQDFLQERGFSTDKNLFLTSDISESWRLLDMGNVDFVVEDVKIIEYMAAKHLTNSKRIENIIPLPELTFDAWLAANPNIDDAIVEKLTHGLSQ